MGANLVAVVFTVVFTRVLGADGYGSLAALLNLSVILFVPGAALQVAAAREGDARPPRPGRRARRRRSSAGPPHPVGRRGVAVVSALAREPLAAVLDVEQEWAAAAVPLTGVMWLLLCVQRGLLQSARAYRAVGRASCSSRLAPRARLAELDQVGTRFAGQGPTLMTETEPYGVRHFLRNLDPEGAAEPAADPPPRRARPCEGQVRRSRPVPTGGGARLQDDRSCPLAE